MFLLSPISFPNLGITVDPNPVAFTVFGKDIYWYGIIIALGFLLAVIYMMRRAPVFGLTQDDVLDEVLWAVPIGVICARLYYCIFYWELYADNPISILYLWEGGLAIYGGVIGGGARGAVAGSVVGVGVVDGSGAVTYYHPAFLYESVWNLVGFLALHFLTKKRKFDGQIFLSYLTWYGLGRVWIEGLRTDSLYLFSTGIRVSQLVAALCVVFAGGALAFILIRKKPDPEKLYVNRKAESEAEAAQADEEAEKPENL